MRGIPRGPDEGGAQRRMRGKAMMLGRKHRALREQPPHLAFGHPLPALRGEGASRQRERFPFSLPAGVKRRVCEACLARR